MRRLPQPAFEEILEGLREMRGMLHVHILDTLEAFQRRPALGKQRFCREKVLLALVGASDVQKHIDKLPQKRMSYILEVRRNVTTHLRVFSRYAVLEHEIDQRRYVLWLRLLVS